MTENRSVPAATVIPVLSYENIGEASRWLCEAFGFRERLVIGDHRIQLHVGDGGGAVILTQRPNSQGPHSCHSVLVRVADAESHYERAKQHGAHVTRPLESFPFGERQYSVQDPGGRTTLGRQHRLHNGSRSCRQALCGVGGNLSRGTAS